MARKIVITSGKGGVGKTSATASIGIALAEKGKSVILIDGDIGLNNLDIVLGMEKQTTYDMIDVIENRCSLRQAITQLDDLPLSLLPSSLAYSNENICVKEFRSIIARLDIEYDFILIDCPAGIDEGFHRAVCVADEAIVVTTPHLTAIKDADKALNLVASYGIRNIDLIINRVRGDLLVGGELMKVSDITNALRYPAIGVIPEDDNITVYSQLGRINFNRSCSRDAFDMVAENLLFGARRLYDCSSNYKGFIGSIKRLFRKVAM